MRKNFRFTWVNLSAASYADYPHRLPHDDRPQLDPPKRLDPQRPEPQLEPHRGDEDHEEPQREGSVHFPPVLESYESFSFGTFELYLHR